MKINKDLLEKIEEMLLVKYDRHVSNDDETVEVVDEFTANCIIEDLFEKIEELKEDIEDLKDDIEDNYRPVSHAEMSGMRDEDFM